jgi:hypothetical protein
MPYDSATGSSGPAHQACEYAVPIVCADIADLREMAADEDMAVSFYRIGDANHLAEQLTTILTSPELQRRMAEHNYAAGVRMTMSCVIRNYLRWFELQKCKKAMRNGRGVIDGASPASQDAPLPPDWPPSGLPDLDEDGHDLGSLELSSDNDGAAELQEAPVWDLGSSRVVQ